MTQIKRVSYAKDFIETIKEYFDSGRYNGDAMDCADMFRHDEWKVDDDAPYAENTRNDLIELGSKNLKLSVWIIEVINCMRYNKSMEME